MALSLTFSALAFAIVLANIIAGVMPQADESTSAHLWQLLMAAQLPLIALFVATANWQTRASSMRFGLQVAAIIAACVPVWLAGY